MPSEPGEIYSRAIIKYLAVHEMVDWEYYVVRIPGEVGEHICQWVKPGVLANSDLTYLHPDNTKGPNIAYPIRLHKGEQLEIT